MNNRHMKNIDKFLVDNSGAGNCLYYSYGISLMYFLRAKGNQDITNKIFENIGLTKDQIAKLQGVLDTNKDKPFSDSDEKNVIEPILGKKLRDLTAERTKQNFLEAPLDSPLFSSAYYGLEYAFKRALSEDYAKLIDNDFDNRNLKDAEIYRVPNILSAMSNFAKRERENVVAEFEKRFALQVENPDALKPRDLEFKKQQILGAIIRDKTIEFFKEDDNKHLNSYRDHLATNFVWAAEENLLLLHRNIQGERMVRDSEGQIDLKYDVNIQLDIYIDGQVQFGATKNPDMILDNKSNAHWVSIIEPAAYQVKPKPVKDEVIQAALPLESSTDTEIDIDDLLGEPFNIDEESEAEQVNATLDALHRGKPAPTEGFGYYFVKAIKDFIQGIKDAFNYVVEGIKAAF